MGENGYLLGFSRENRRKMGQEGEKKRQGENDRKKKIKAETKTGIDISYARRFCSRGHCHCIS